MINHLESFGWKGAFRGMRNPLQSHDKSDSNFNSLSLGKNDLKLAKKLIKAGASHRKFLRQIHIQCDITAPTNFFGEFATYQYVVSNSTSMMHKMGSTELTQTDFAENTDKRLINILNEKIKKYQWSKDVYGMNDNETKTFWRDMINSVPQSFLYIRTVDFNYEVFLSMYFQRKNHKMEEWVEFCAQLRDELPYICEFISVLEVK